MKRILLLVLLLLVLGGGFAFWWYTQDTPQKVLADGAQGLISMQSAQSVSADVAVTDLASRTTTGFSVEGQFDTSDLALVKGLGELRLGAQTQQGQDETLDVVVNASSVLLHPNDVTAEHRALYQSLLGDASGTAFVLFDRAAFLKKFGYPAAISTAKSADIRATLQSILPTITPGASLKMGVVNGVQAITTDFRFDETALNAFLVALVKTWTGKNLTPDGFAWVGRVTGDMGRGTWTMSINQATRQPIEVGGMFSLLDDAGNELKRVRATVDLSGINGKVMVPLPPNAKDATASISPAPQNALPGAAPRTVPAGFVTSTAATADQRQLQDLFTKYSDTLRKKKNAF